MWLTNSVYGWLKSHQLHGPLRIVTCTLLASGYCNRCRHHKQQWPRLAVQPAFKGSHITGQPAHTARSDVSSGLRSILV